LKKYLLAGLFALALSTAAFAAGSGVNRVFKDAQGNSATLLLEPCTLDFLSPEARESAKAARLFIDGKHLKGCYKENESFVIIIDEEQDILGPFPKEMFKPVKEA
jgi:uncharacterized membrane protein